MKGRVSVGVRLGFTFAVWVGGGVMVRVRG